MNSAIAAVPSPANLFALNSKRADRGVRAADGVRSQNVPNREVSKLLTAAVVSKAFCQLLLTNPAQALEDGYNGMRFALSNQEKELLLSIQAASLSELASQINNRNGNIAQSAPLVSPLMQV
jgi:hypothetical protein